MKKFSIFGVKFFIVFLAVGFFTPTVNVEVDQTTGVQEVHFTVLKELEARRGGGGMRRSGGFNRDGGMRRSSYNRSRMRAPSRNRYQRGNFSKSKRPVVSRPKTRPATRPAKKPSSSIMLPIN